MLCKQTECVTHNLEVVKSFGLRNPTQTAKWPRQTKRQTDRERGRGGKREGDSQTARQPHALSSPPTTEGNSLCSKLLKEFQYCDKKQTRRRKNLDMHENKSKSSALTLTLSVNNTRM